MSKVIKAMVLIGLVVTPLSLSGLTKQVVMEVVDEGRNFTVADVQDIDGDGQNELLVGSAQDTALLIYSKSGSSWVLEDQIEFDEIPRSLVYADVDNDGVKELIVGTGNTDAGGRVYVGRYENGSFYTEWQSEMLYSIRFPDELSVGDSDNDGLKEIAVGVSWYGRYLVVYEFNGSGYDEIFTDDIWSDCNATKFGDVDGDGIDELILSTSCWGDYSLRIYDNFSLIYTYYTAVDNKSLALWDLDGDGLDEIIMGSGSRCGDWNCEPPTIRIFDYQNGAYSLVLEDTVSGFQGLHNGYSLIDVGEIVFNDTLRTVIAFVGGSWHSEKRSFVLMEYEGAGLTEIYRLDSEPDSMGLNRDCKFGDVDNDGFVELVIPSRQALLVYNFTAVYSEHYPDLTPTDLDVEHQNNGLLITVIVANFGDTARSIPVRFMVEDLMAGTGELLTIADSVIDELDPGQSTTVSTFWTPRFSSYAIYVSVDPENIIPEANEENNIIYRVFGATGPVVEDVVAEYDEEPDEDIFGRYISGVELINRFTAQVTDPDSAEDVARVLFIFGSDTLVDDDPSDGWSVEYDVGQLPNAASFKVIAYDRSGVPSEPAEYTINTVPMPEWLQTYTQTFGCEFYFDYDEGVYRTGMDYFPLDAQGNYSIPGDVLLLGNLETRLTGGVRLVTAVPLTRRGDLISVEPEYGLTLLLLGQEVFHGDLSEWSDFPLVQLDAYLDPSNLQLSSMEVHMSRPFLFPQFVLPEVRRDIPVTVSGIPITIVAEIGGEITPRLNDAGAYFREDLDFDSLFVEPAVAIIVDLSARVEVVFGVASIGFIAHPTADIMTRLVYPPVDFHFSGAFLVPFELVGSLGWGVVSGTLYQDTLGPWTFGTEGERILAERMPLLLARLDSLNLPDILPNPYMATDPYGHAMVVWIHDNDPTPGRADPDVYYAVWDGTLWGSAQPIESGSNDRFELDPVVAFMPNGDAIAVWSANTAPGYIKDLNSIFGTQDIYYSIWNHTTGEWGDVQQLISDSLPDGLASVAVGPQGQVLVAWNKILSDSISDKRSWAVYYTYWDGTHWTDPAPIPGTDTDNAADCMVRVAYSPDGTAIAVWLYDGDGDFTTTFDTDLKYAIWDGQSWSSAEMLTSTAQEAEQAISVVFDSLGRAIVVWTAKDSTIDRLYFSMMDTTSDWSTPELIYETPQFAYQPIVQVTNQGIVMVFWRGYQGYDGDLFYTMKDLRNGSGWLQPRALTDDSLTDWLATMAIDANNNALYIWSKWNWTGSQPLMAEDGRYFADGLFFAGKGIKSDMSLGDLNMGAHPILPDLAVSNSSMAVSDRFAALGDTVTVSAVVWNSGDVASDTVTVRFTYGHPDSGGVMIEPEFRIALEPDSSETLTVQWVVQPGVNRIYVVIDPENVEQELSEANNIAFVDCYVVADLAIDSTDISFDDPNPLVGDTVTVMAWVHNIGSVASDSVLVVFYDGNPDDSTSILLDSMRIGAVAPDDSVQVEAQLAATYGEHRIFVAIDPENELLEPDKSNNMAFARLKVLPDLFVNELSFDTVGFDTVEVVAVIANDGGVSAGSFTVAFYDGDPMVGGELLDSVALDSMSAFSEDTVAVLWTPTPGQHEVFVVVDPDDEVPERNEFNNRLSGSIFVQGRPDLAISDDGIATSDDHPHSGDTLTITAWVRNIGLANALAAYVRLYLVDGDTSFIDGVVLPVVEAGDSAEAQFDWIIPDDFTGTARLMVYADPNDSIPELDETNNAATTCVFVNTPEITALPDEFDVIVDSSVTVSETLIVRNTGSADLIFNIAVDYGKRMHLAALLDGAKPDTGWLDVSVSCDTVAENDSTMVEIAMNSEGLSYGYHLATLEIANNDSANPMVEIPVRFGVRPPAPEPISPADSELVADSMPTFVWSIADGFTGTFVLQIALDPEFSSNLIEISNISDTVYTMEQPLGDTTYWWRVKAVTSDGLEGDFSAPHMFVVDAHAPSAPVLESPIDGVWLNDTLITLHWSRTHIFGWRKPEGTVMGKGSSKTGKKKRLELIEVLKQHDDGAKSTPVHYVVEVLRDSLTVLVDTVDTNLLTVTLAEGRYGWRVMAFDEAGNASDWSPIDSFGVDVTPPSGVELIAPENNSILNTSEVTFDWSDAVDTASGVAGYWFAVSMDSTFALADSYFVSVSETTISLSDTTWFWKVKSVDVAGLESDWTAAWMLTIDTGVPETPELISPIGGIWLNDTVMALQWSRSVVLSKAEGKSTPVHYVVEVMRDSLTVLVDTVDTNFLMVALAEGRYNWHVMAFDEAGNTSDWSPTDSFGVDVTPPRTPDLVSPADGFITSSNSMEFIWTASSDNLSGIMGYSLTLGDSVWNTSDTSMTVDLSYFSEGTYAWHIEVFDNAENFAITDDRTLVIDRTPPLIDSFTLWPDTSWFFGPFEVDAWISDNLSGVGSAWLFWSVDGSPFDSTAMSPSNGVWSGEIPAIDDSANHTVSYFVKALDNAESANVSTSDTVSFTVISIEESQNQGLPSKFELLGVVQNPVKGGLIGLRLAVPSPCDAKFAIYDVTGRCVWRTTSHFEAGYHDVNLRADLRSGVYFIEVSAPFGKADVKVVISR